MQNNVQIPNGSGYNVRTGFNGALQSLVTNFSGASEPNPTFPNMFWADTSGANDVLKQRSSANDAWIILGAVIDGVFKSADRATIETVTITLGTTWTGSAAPFSQDVTVADLLATDSPQVGIVLSSDYETAQAQLKEFAKIYRGVTSAGKVTFYAKAATTAALTLQLKIIR